MRSTKEQKSKFRGAALGSHSATTFLQLHLKVKLIVVEKAEHYLWMTDM